MANKESSEITELPPAARTKNKIDSYSKHNKKEPIAEFSEDIQQPTKIDKKPRDSGLPKSPRRVGLMNPFLLYHQSLKFNSTERNS